MIVSGMYKGMLEQHLVIDLDKAQAEVTTICQIDSLLYITYQRL